MLWLMSKKSVTVLEDHLILTSFDREEKSKGREERKEKRRGGGEKGRKKDG